MNGNTEFSKLIYKNENEEIMKGKFLDSSQVSNCEKTCIHFFTIWEFYSDRFAVTELHYCAFASIIELHAQTFNTHSCVCLLPVKGIILWGDYFSTNMLESVHRVLECHLRGKSESLRSGKEPRWYQRAGSILLELTNELEGSSPRK